MVSRTALRQAGFYRDGSGALHGPRLQTFDSEGNLTGFKAGVEHYVAWWEYWYPNSKCPVPRALGLGKEVSSGTAGLAMPITVGSPKVKVKPLPDGKTGTSPKVPPGKGANLPDEEDEAVESAHSEKNCLCDKRERIQRFMIQEDYMPVGIRMLLTESQAETIPYFAKILAAVPGLSQNRRNYPAGTLSRAVPLYPTKPFILDHDYEDTWKVMGQIRSAFYGTDYSKYRDQDYEGLWLTATGVMPVQLFEKIAGWCPADGGPCVPPMVRGVSIGGEGEGDPYGQGVNIKRFVPQELSVTAFPGIPDAHIAEFERLTESISTMPTVQELLSLNA